ncbi:MAG: cupin domain-containing protein [Clostridia bacterium]|nr:cupin domain-containing protein [Clostridia bacterium]
MEIVNAIKGIIELKTQDQSFLLHTGDAAYVNTGVLHMYQAQGTEPAEL